MSTNSTNSSTEEEIRIKCKEKKIELNNGWNKTMEQNLKELGEKCMGLQWMHDHSERSLLKKHKIFTISNIMIQAFVGTSIFGQLIYKLNSSIIYIIITGLIAFFSTGITVLLENINYKKQASAHHDALTEYSRIFQKINYELSLYRQHRQKGNDYITWIQADYNRIQAVSPNISNSTIDAFIHGFKDKKIQIPDIAGGLNEIKIINEKNNGIVKGSFIQYPNKVEDPDVSELSDIEEEIKMDPKIKYEIDRYTRHDFV